MFILPADQKFIDDLISQFDLDKYEVEDELKNYLPDLAKSKNFNTIITNTYIGILLEQVRNKFLDEFLNNETLKQWNEDDDSEAVTEAYRDKLNDHLISYEYTNCLDSGNQLDYAITEFFNAWNLKLTETQQKIIDKYNL